MKIKSGKQTSELAETMYDVVGEKFQITWRQTDDYVVADMDRELTQEQVSQFLQDSDSSLARPIRGDQISESTRTSLKQNISDIQDNATKEALKDIYNILTGEEI